MIIRVLDFLQMQFLNFLQKFCYKNLPALLNTVKVLATAIEGSSSRTGNQNTAYY